MDAVLRSADEVVAALGGSRGVADKFGLQQSRVSMWMKRKRIPSELFLPVSAALKAQGKNVDPSVFGMAVPSDDTEQAS